MLIVIIQARMTSKRLPGKVLAELGGQPLLATMIDRVRRAKNVDALLVATTVNSADDSVAELAETQNVSVFRGDEDDVLGRYAAAAATTSATEIVRLTADCPFADPDLIDLAVDAFRGTGADYLGNAHERTYPDGLDVEIMTAAALGRADREAISSYDREHVTPYIYRNTDTFRVSTLRHEADFSHLRWTVDTQDDLDRLRELISRLPPGFNWQQALAETTWSPALMGISNELRRSRVK